MIQDTKRESKIEKEGEIEIKRLTKRERIKRTKKIRNWWTDILKKMKIKHRELHRERKESRGERERGDEQWTEILNSKRYREREPDRLRGKNTEKLT